MTRPSLAEDATPDAFALAMIACEGYGPSCSDMNECAQGGACFTSAQAGKRQALTKIERLIREEDNASVKSWLVIALDLLKGE